MYLTTAFSCVQIRVSRTWVIDQHQKQRIMLNTFLGLSMPGTGEGLLLIMVGALFFFYWIKTLVEVIRRDFPDTFTKGLWLVIIFVFGIIGAAVYNFFERETHPSQT